MADWDKIRREYVAGGTTAKRLSEKYNVPVATIYNHSRKERWAAEQKLHAETVRKKYAQKSAADIENIKRRIDGIVAKLAERADTIAETLEKPADVRQLTLAVKDLADLVGKRDPLAAREMEARIKALERQAEPEQQEQIEIIIPDTAKDWSE